ncbi:type IX secretion/gliding motility protein PorT/SprT [Crocinitomix catalasitica]|uniref:type IX secretion/gliding motility protein PorT/SprT n=1 Tax=Crocinitomix catalasitica TaxID=184607 RepID=UPI000683F93D|nr:outer membrane beta-barrel protein [Crocinitomix catalasitica]
MKISRYITILFLLLSVVSFGQRYGKNIPNFERNKFHFGIALGVTSTAYNYTLKQNYSSFDSVYNVSIKSGPGFAIHIPLISWNLSPTVHLRTIPSLTFHESTFEYSYISNGKTEIKQTRSEPVLVNLPLILKLNTKRINNFSAYAIGGLVYSFDLASQEDVEQKVSDPIIKLTRHDFSYQVGGGFDFYLPYFKFGIEIKLSNGMKNLLIQDDTFFSSPLESLKTRVWWFSLTFEG